MIRLTTAKRVRVLSLLLEGMSLRSIERLEGTSIVTISRLLDLAGNACALYHYDNVCDIAGKLNIQCDEIWSFVYAKQKRIEDVEPWDMAGTVWTWTALDADSKLLVAYRISPNRDTQAATELLADLAGRLTERPRIVADSLKSYRKAAKRVFGKGHKRVLSQIRKGEDTEHSTAYVERHNLTIRMSNRRYARKTNAFSKMFSKHIAMMHLWALHYNFCRIHSTLRVTPAMEAGLTDTLHDVEWIVQLIDLTTAASKKPGLSTYATVMVIRHCILLHVTGRWMLSTLWLARLMPRLVRATLPGILLSMPRCREDNRKLFACLVRSVPIRPRWIPLETPHCTLRLSIHLLK